MSLTMRGEQEFSENELIDLSAQDLSLEPAEDPQVKSEEHS